MKAVLRWVAFVLLALGSAGAQAAITCTTITSDPLTIFYAAGTTTGVQVALTLTCSRGSTSDPTSTPWSVTANNGLHAKRANNFARLTQNGKNYDLSYDVYTTGCGGAQWSGRTTISGTLTWAAGQTGNATATAYYWGCINKPQTPTAAGWYTDTIGLTATYDPGAGPNQKINGTIDVSIYAPATCVINPPPGSISITYPAFSPLALSGTTTFGATCTDSMPYTLDVSPASGTLAGVNYTVGLSAASAVGTGAIQTFTVTVTALAGQSGTCSTASCTATQTHTLTIAY